MNRVRSSYRLCQLLTAGAARLAGALVEALQERIATEGIYERSEGGVRAEEGVPGTVDPLRRRGVLIRIRGTASASGG